MTVPGKGGRPRKWSSDADRMRAYRARRRGEPEPETLEAALDADDKLAEALGREWRLLQQLAKANELLRQAKAAATVAERQLGRERERFVWMVDDNARLRAECEAHSDLESHVAELNRRLVDACTEVERLVRENVRLRAELSSWRSADELADAPQDASRPANRAERRRAARRR